MNSAFLMALAAIILSVLGHTTLAIRGSRFEKYKTLSQLAYLKPEFLKWFRATMFSGVALLTTAMLLIDGASSKYGWYALVLFISLVCVGGVWLAIIPASGLRRQDVLHNVFAYMLCLGLYLIGILLVIATKRFELIAYVCLIIMTATTPMTILDKKRFLFYELAFIYSGYLSLLLTIYEYSQK